MRLVDRINAARAEQRAIAGVPWQPWADPYVRFDVGGPLHPSKQAGAAGIDNALRLQPVYSSVRLLAEGVAQLPWQQYRDTGKRPVKMPLGQLLQKPSAYLNAFDWRYQFVSSAALDGTAFGLITDRDGYGFPTTIEWLPPDQVQVTDSSPYNPAKTQFFFAGRSVSRDQLLLVRAFTIPGRTRGIAPIRYFQMLIESGLDALAYGADWYKSGGFPPGHFQNTQYEIEDEQANAIRRKLVRAQRNREPLVYGRDWTYTPIIVPPDQAQFINAMQLNATQVAAIFGVPPHRVGGTRDSNTYSNVESESIGFVQDSLDPWLVRLESALENCLPASQYCQFNRNARLRMTPETRFAVYRAARDIGVMNVDEIRQEEDRDPIPRPVDPDDYDGTDYTPLQIQVAAARGIKEIIGEGTGGQGGTGGVETNPGAQRTPPASGQEPAVPAGRPAPVPAANGSSNGRGPGPARPAR